MRYNPEDKIVVFDDISDSTEYTMLLDARTGHASKNYQEHSFSETVYNSSGEVTSMSSASYLSTDFSSDDITILLRILYE